MKVNSNIQAMFAHTILANNEEKMAKSTQKMSSGYSINRAMDNPAGMAISNRMRAQLQSLDRANKNAKNAVNAVQTAEGAMGEVEEMLQRMNELAVQAANGTMSSSDRKAIQEEVDQLTDEITRISKNTTYNTQTMLDGSQDFKGYSNKPAEVTVRNYNEQFITGNYTVEVDANGSVTIKDVNGVDVKKSEEITEYTEFDETTQTDVVTGRAVKINTKDGGQLTLNVKTANAVTGVTLDIKGIGGMKVQTGSEEDQEIQIIIPEVSLRTLDLVDYNGNKTLKMETEEGATKAIDTISRAIDYISAARSKVGAYQNRVEKTISNLDVTIENLTESYSTIKDLDMAEGMVEYTTLQVLIQAGTSMLAQANEQPQQALQLLQ